MGKIFWICLVFLIVFSSGTTWAEPEETETVYLEYLETPWSEIENMVLQHEEEKNDDGKIQISGDYTLAYKVVFPSEEMNRESYSYWTDRLNLNLTLQISEHLTVGIHLKTSDILIDP